MILIVTNKNDSHADRVIQRLAERQADVFRLNTEDLASKYKTELRMNTGGIWSGTIENEKGRVLDLTTLRCGWLRKPVYSTARTVRDLGASDYILSESKSLVEVLYCLPGVCWVNNPFSAKRSRVKLWQLRLAAELGMRVPQTIVTSNAVEARRFISDCGGKAITKAIYTSNVTIDDTNQGILSRKLSLDDFDLFSETLELCPTLFQEYCEKKFELRVTVIGRSVFAVKIDSQLDERTKVDWRADTLISPHSKFLLPEWVTQFCLAFMDREGLVYGAMDFIVQKDDAYIFLENNPFGNYQWLEDAAGVPLSAELAKLLEDMASGSARGGRLAK